MVPAFLLGDLEVRADLDVARRSHSATLGGRAAVSCQRNLSALCTTPALNTAREQRLSVTVR